MAGPIKSTTELREDLARQLAYKKAAQPDSKAFADVIKQAVGAQNSILQHVGRLIPARQQGKSLVLGASVAPAFPIGEPSDGAMHTASGHVFDILNPSWAPVYLEDIAHHLSRINRYTGATKFQNYSVAQHSVMCSWAARLLYPEMEMACLLHDGHEAYINDISTPMKRAIEAMGGKGIIEKIERPIEDAIWKELGRGAPRDHRKVKAIDVWAAYREMQDILVSCPALNGKWQKKIEILKDIPAHTLKALDAEVGKIKSGWEPEHAKKVFLDTYEQAARRLQATMTDDAYLDVQWVDLEPQASGAHTYTTTDAAIDAAARTGKGTKP